MVESKEPDEIDHVLIEIPHELRRRFQEAIKGVYSTESEAIRDLIRRFAESRGC